MLRGLAKSIIGGVRRPFAVRRLKRQLARPDTRKLILGASTTGFPGWLSTDISWRTRHYLDASRTWPVRAGSLTHIYADNMIEHVDLHGARTVLREAWKALEPGGRIRLVTPDIEATARIYLTPGELRDRVLARARQDDGQPGVYPVDIIRCVLTQAGHHFGQAWDRESLTAELANAGFADITYWKTNRSDVHEFQNMETREADPAVEEVTLIVEARKPI